MMAWGKISRARPDREAKKRLEKKVGKLYHSAAAREKRLPDDAMRTARANSVTISEDEARSLTDFIMYSQRNFILRLSPELNQGKVSYPQFFLLAYLEEEECLSMTSIARMMGHSTAAATGMVDKLEELGHLKRFTAASDRRKTMVRITEGGRELLARMRGNIARDISSMMAEEDHAMVRKARKLISDTKTAL